MRGQGLALACAAAFGVGAVAALRSITTRPARLVGYRGSVLHFLKDPLKVQKREESYEYFEDGCLVVEDGKVVACGTFEEMSRNHGGMSVKDCRPYLICPGFLDSHVHFPQLEMVAAYGQQLLEWLKAYVFPAEAKFADPAYANSRAKTFVKELLRHGTTTALVHCTVHEESVEALFTETHRRDMLMIAGKVMMDAEPFAPDELRMTADQSVAAVERLIAKWHNTGRCLYAVTPRFAITSTPRELTLCGELCKKHADKGIYMQTHMNENKDEIELAKELHKADSYLAVYDNAGLLGSRSVLAHCVHMQDKEWDRMVETKTAMSFCPSSNMFLGSGLVDLATVRKKNVRHGIGSDIGAGTSLCQLQTLQDAYKMGMLSGVKISPWDSFYLATLGTAKSLSLDHRVGNFQTGKEADFLLMDLTPTELLKFRMPHAKTLDEKLFILSTLGDDRNIAATYVAGVCQHERDA